MPFGAWTEADWRLRDAAVAAAEKAACTAGPYLLQDEASTPSHVLLEAKAEARRLRSTVSLSKPNLVKTLSRGSMSSTHWSSRWHNSSTSIGEFQTSVDTSGVRESDGELTV
ncbi:unnamed protein product [Durusdinium trenchii]|uniref:Uncharacterized protein n=1 Tax=Durusdinium trenchii TaxID=1381693 RepID=A0ABP0MZV0_9DINO